MTKRLLSDGEVIGALMTARTKAEAAELLGVSRQTVYNYMNGDGFEEKLNEAIEERERIIGAAREDATLKAIECLAEIVAGESGWPFLATDADRIEAARVLLTAPAARLDKR